MPSGAYEYDVALSFAGEDREYVEKVAEHLRDNGIAVFYDRYEEAELWGKNLYEHLDGVYRLKARFCIVFISEAYAAKLWTNHERESAQSRAFSENQEYLLPARFDSSEIPGIRPTTGYVDLTKKSPKDLGRLIVEKARLPQSIKRGTDGRVISEQPSTESDSVQSTSIKTKKVGWAFAVSIVIAALILVVFYSPGLKIHKNIREVVIPNAETISLAFSDNTHSIEIQRDGHYLINLDLRLDFINRANPYFSCSIFRKQTVRDPETISSGQNHSTECRASVAMRLNRGDILSVKAGQAGGIARKVNGTFGVESFRE